jgi:signal peptidase
MSPVYTITRTARRTLDLLLILSIVLVIATVVIARVVPWLTGGTTFVVGGGSMEPAIPLGAVVIAAPVTDEDLAVGDVVSVQVGEQHAIFTHRITRLVDRDGDLWLQTKGDANEDPDPSIIPASSVIGRADVVLRYAGYAVQLLGSGQGVLFLLAFGVFTLAGAWLLESLEIDQAIARARMSRRLTPMTPDGPAGEGSAG